MFKNNEMKTCFSCKPLSRWSRSLSTLATRTTSLRRSRSQGRSLSPLSRLLRTRREPSTRLPHHLQQLCPPERGMTNHRLLLSSVPYYNVIFIPGKWHQRPALRKKKAAFFKRFNHQSSNSQPKLEVNLVAMVCLCSPEATCPSSLHLEGCLSPKPTSSSWPSSATPALYSQDRWFTFPIKFVKLPSCRWIVTTWSPPTCLLERSAMICHIRWIQPSSSFGTLDHLLQACSEEDARRDFSKRNTVYKKWIVIWKPVNE